MGRTRFKFSRAGFPLLLQQWSVPITLFVFASVWIDVGWANEFCAQALAGSGASVNLSPTTVTQTRVTDLRSFSRAMTEGLLLRPEQKSLFDIYMNESFGDPKTSLELADRSGKLTFDYVQGILKKHPSLTKPLFREYYLDEDVFFYESPADLTQFVEKKIRAAQSIKTRLFQIEQSLPYWADLLDLKIFAKEGKREPSERNRLVLIFLQRSLTKQAIEALKSKEVSYAEKQKLIYNFLRRLISKKQSQGKDSTKLNEALVELVSTSGFNDKNILSLLRDSNALVKIEGLSQAYQKRDLVAELFGFSNHFQELLMTYPIRSKSLIKDLKSEQETLNVFRNRVQKEVANFNTSSRLRIRSLSIQESPFRSCLGGTDCSSRTYPTKALDPNYIYFTLTDSTHHSSGHMTFVLGLGQRSDGQVVKVAFLDKVQFVSVTKINAFLEGARLSLAEEGYVIGIPENVGDHNGVSNAEEMRKWIQDKILIPSTEDRITNYQPHEHSWYFENRYSRAYDKPAMRILKSLQASKTFHLTGGSRFRPFLSEENLNIQTIVANFFALKDSSDEADQFKFIHSYETIPLFKKYINYDTNEFLSDLTAIYSDSNRSFSVRKRALFEKIKIQRNLLETLRSLEFSLFSLEEWTQIVAEIRNWKSSNLSVQKDLYHNLESNLEAVFNGLFSDIRFIDILLISQIYQLDFKTHRFGPHRDSFLMLMIKYKNDKIQSFLVSRSLFNLSAKNNLGRSVFYYLADLYVDVKRSQTQASGFFGFQRFATFQSSQASVNILDSMAELKEKNQNLWKSTFSERLNDYKLILAKNSLSNEEKDALKEYLFLDEELEESGKNYGN